MNSKTYTMRKKQKLLLEIFIWIFLLGGLILLGINILGKQFNKYQSYQVIFKDIDGLIVGSPVRVMGIQVGHISKIKPKKDEVNIDFKITEENLKIPAGSIASVQFTGIAGSKSLEILPPKTPKSQNTPMEVIEPIRVGTIMDLQTEISESILKTSENVIKFFGKNEPQEIGKTIKLASTVTEKTVSKVQKNTVKIRDARNKASKSLAKTRNDFEQGIKQMDFINNLNNTTLNKNLKESGNSLNNIFKNVSDSVDNWKSQNMTSQLGSKLKQLDQNLVKLNSKIKNIGYTKFDQSQLQNSTFENE